MTVENIQKSNVHMMRTNYLPELQRVHVQVKSKSACLESSQSPSLTGQDSSPIPARRNGIDSDFQNSVEVSMTFLLIFLSLLYLLAFNISTLGSDIIRDR